MKLKIDQIQQYINDNELYSDFKYCTRIIHKEQCRYVHINYQDKQAHIASEILASILSDLTLLKLKSFEENYKLIDYQFLPNLGFYLGIPFYKPLPTQYAEKIANLKNKAKNINDDDQIKNLKYNLEYNKHLIHHFDTIYANKSFGERKNIFLKLARCQHYLVNQKIELIDQGSIDCSIYKINNILQNTIRFLEDKPFKISREIDDFKALEVVQQKRLENLAKNINKQIELKVNSAKIALKEYLCENIEIFFTFILKDSFYWFDFDCDPLLEYSAKDKSLIVEYHLPNLTEIPNIKEIKHYKTKSSEIKYLSEREQIKIYDDFIYAITIRSLSEVFHFDSERAVDTIMFNGRVISRNSATGQLEDNCILSIQVKRDEFEKIDLNYVDAKACFKHFKGVGAAKLSSMSAVVPIMETSRYDKRFRDAKEVAVNDSTNLAAMHWEDFEHLIRELFEKEFSANGGEVKVTQASRDGGVDAIAFDPDPIRGGKIVIQAKRYTNTVGVSAVRDLYGTVINEGANKGILITTSDYGSDSYSFARAKPLTLLNGGHLLYLLEKHGKSARIDIDEAKRLAKEGM